MGKSTLRRKLERMVDRESVELVLPYPFLPPRFQKEAKRRNLLLVLGTTRELSLRWEGTLISREGELSPRQTQALLREVRRRIGEYEKGLEVVHRFLNGIHNTLPEEEESEEEETEAEDYEPNHAVLKATLE